MKLRILNNSVRLRLSQSEVKHMKDAGIVEASMVTGPGKNDVFTYSLETSESDVGGLQFTSNKLVISIPAELINTWALTDQVSINYIQNNGDKEELSILIEKDFKCLTDRPGEDESDMFPHPGQDKMKC